jgi:hypothetical protein
MSSKGRSARCMGVPAAPGDPCRHERRTEVPQNVPLILPARDERATNRRQDA